MNNIVVPDKTNSISRLHNNTSAMSAAINDPRKNDLKYACLKIKKADFFCTKENLIKHSRYLMRVFERQEESKDQKERNSQIRIKLPESTKADILIMFLDNIDKGKEFPNKLDLYIVQNIILIAEALKMRQIQRKYLLEILMPMLNRENVIFFLKMSYNKLSSQKNDEQILQDDLESQTSHSEEEEFWFDFFSYALDLAAQYVQFLIKMKSNELLNVLEPSIVEEIIERAIRFYRADLQYDNTLVFDTLMKVRKCESIFQLLEQERNKIIENEESIIASQENIRPTLTWRIQNLTGNFYRESDPFMVENAQWKLSISYFKMEEEALSVQIKMVNNPFEVKKSKDYFKKKDFFLASNVAGGLQHQNNPLEEALDNENLTQEEILRRKKQIDQANSEYPSHAFITIVSSVRINSDEKLSNPLVHTLICSAKTPALLKKFIDFKIDQYDGAITVEIYFKVKYIYSAILLYISRNFTYLITDPMISLMPKDQFKLILKHKMLSVTHEDEVVKALCMWCEGQDVRANLDQDLVELIENVNWNFVSLQCILDLIRNFPQIRRNPAFHKTINKEFAMRNKFNPETTNLDPPRFSYKYNKALNNTNINKNAKNAKALLYINNENFFQNLLDSLLEPVDIIKAHLVNEGVNESSHRKHLELSLLQKKREILQLEEQIANMKFMEDLGHKISGVSRPNSHLNRSALNQASHIKSGNNKLNCGSGMIGDDVETVKNSMINLLNIGDDQQPPNKQHKLVEISQDAVQQMKNNNNKQSQESQVNYQEMYEDLNPIAQGRKIEILYNTQEESQNEEESSENAVETEIQGNQTDHQEEDEEVKTGVPQQNITESIVIVNEPGNAEQLMRQIQSFTSRSSKIVVGGAILASPTHNYTKTNSLFGAPNAQQELAIVRQTEAELESKGIQTSLPIVETHFSREKIEFHQIIDKIDQSIQMTFEEPPEDLAKNESMIKHEFIDQDDDNFLSHEACSVVGISPPKLKLDRSISEIEQNNEDDPNTKDCTQQIPFLSPQQPNTTPNNDKEVRQEIFDSNFPNQLSVAQKQQFEQLKIKYQKQLMQEYTSIVEKMSKDVFDSNFLKNFQLFSTDHPQSQEHNEGNFQNTYPQQIPQQVQVQNPKVHNLNISIHNNANYGSPFPLDGILTSNFTPIQNYQQNNINNQQQAIQAQTGQHQYSMNIPIKSNLHSPTASSYSSQVQTPTENKLQQETKNHQRRGSSGVQQTKQSSTITYEDNNNKDLKQRPQSSRIKQQTKTNNIKKPMNLQIESNDTYGRPQTSIPYQLPPQAEMQKQKGFIQTGQQQLKIKSSLNPHLANYVTTMPNSVKNSQPNKIYTSFNQHQQQKNFKPNVINKNQNKVILQQILNDNGKSNYASNDELRGMASHMKSKYNNNHTGAPQWSTAQNTDQQRMIQHNSREKSTEHLQNEIMRIIVEDSSSFQPQINQQQQSNKPPSWSQVPMQQSQSFNTKRGSEQQSYQINQALSQVANFNILDHIKQQQMTPQYHHNTQRAFSATQQFKPGQLTSDFKNSTINFGTLATQQKQTSGGTVVLDLAKLRVAADQSINPQQLQANNHYQARLNDLCTIEEQSRKSQIQEIKNPQKVVYNNNSSESLPSQQRDMKNNEGYTGTFNGRREAISNNPSSQSYHSLNNYPNQNLSQQRCQPHDISE